MKFFRKHKKRKIAGIIILLIVLLIGGIYGSIWWKFYGDSVGVVSADKVDPKAKKVKIAKEKRKDKDVYNVLLVGTDSRDPDADRGRSDSMMMVSFNKKEGKSTAISFLRDSLVDIDGHERAVWAILMHTAEWDLRSTRSIRHMILIFRIILRSALMIW